MCFFGYSTVNDIIYGESRGIPCASVQKMHAQLVERETLRVAFYLEVACSIQALEIPFTCCSLSLLFPQPHDVLPCSSVRELTSTRVQLLKMQRKEDENHTRCEQDMCLKECSVVFGIASSLRLGTSEPPPLRHTHTARQAQPSPFSRAHAALAR